MPLKAYKWAITVKYYQYNIREKNRRASNVNWMNVIKALTPYFYVWVVIRAFKTYTSFFPFCSTSVKKNWMLPPLLWKTQNISETLLPATLPTYHKHLKLVSFSWSPKSLLTSLGSLSCLPKKADYVRNKSFPPFFMPLWLHQSQSKFWVRVTISSLKSDHKIGDYKW